MRRKRHSPATHIAVILKLKLGLLSCSNSLSGYNLHFTASLRLPMVICGLHEIRSSALVFAVLQISSGARLACWAGSRCAGTILPLNSGYSLL